MPAQNLTKYRQSIHDLRVLPPGTKEYMLAAINFIDSFHDKNIRRPVELEVLSRLPSKNAISNDRFERHGYNIPESRLFGADCNIVAKLLTSQGSYMVAQDFYEDDKYELGWELSNDPERIADELVRRGFGWVKVKHVIIAQRIKHDERRANF